MKSQSYYNFWQRIHRAAKNNGSPLRVMFELTYRCNFRCRHCYVPQSYRKYKEIKTEDVFSILEQLKDIGCFYLGFTGGEPLIREDIIEILWYAKKCGFELIIYTNGSLINEKIASQLQRLRPNKVDITIPAMSKDAFERISGVSGSRDKVFRAIELLHKNGVNLGFKSCVLKENESEIREIQNFAASLSALHRLDDMLSPSLDGSNEPYRYRGRLKNSQLTTSDRVQATRKDDLEECDFDTENLIPNTSDRTRITGNFFKCGVGVSQVAITPFGELKMCVMIDYPKYNILKSSLKDTWEKLKKLVQNIKPDENYQCDKCELEPYCKWCPARAWLENRNFTSCDPESQRWAELRKKSYENRS